MHAIYIFIMSIAAAVLYGTVHNQISVTISPEFISTFRHMTPLSADAPIRLVAFYIGITTTWWVGGIVGVPLALAARFGPVPKVDVREMAPWMFALLILVGVCAGNTAYQTLAFTGSTYQAAGQMHNASYAYGFAFGGKFVLLVLGVRVYRLLLSLKAWMAGETARFEKDRKPCDSGGAEVRA